MKRLAVFILILALSTSFACADTTNSNSSVAPTSDTGKTIAQRYHINKIWAFGDSLTDTGNKGVTNEYYDPHRATNRCEETNQGKLWIEFFAEDLGLSAPTPSGHRNNRDHGKLAGGTNFAIMGARVAADGSGDVPEQISAYLAKYKPKPTDLFCINGGANDTVNRNALHSVAKIREEGLFNTGHEAEVANSMMRQVTRLVDAGAKRVMIQAVPDLGMTPVAIKSGMASMATAWAAKVNEILKSQVDKLEASGDVDIIYIDTFKIMHDLCNQCEDLGIKAVSTSYCIGDPEKKFWLRTYVGDGATPFSGGTPYTPSECMFWDPIHPTTKGHQCIAKLIYREFCRQVEELPDDSVSRQ